MYSQYSYGDPGSFNPAVMGHKEEEYITDQLR